MKSLHGFYRGIIVQNNDPQKLGRVKVFVPHIHMAMLDIEKEDYDKEFYFAEFVKITRDPKRSKGSNQVLLDQIKALLPGAEDPTVLPLSADKQKMAVHLVSSENLFWETMEQLKELGASSILVLPIEKMME